MCYLKKLEECLELGLKWGEGSVWLEVFGGGKVFERESRSRDGELFCGF